MYKQQKFINSATPVVCCVIIAYKQTQSWSENSPVQAPSLLYFVLTRYVKVHIFKTDFVTQIYKML